MAAFGAARCASGRRRIWYPAKARARFRNRNAQDRASRSARRLMPLRRAGNTHSEALLSRVLGLLGQPLDPLLVSERETRDGRLVRYIEGCAAIGQANRIFGFNGWGRRC